MLTSEEKQRYSRQMIMAEIGEAGQERLGAARVLVAGLGGLGSISALYLAAAGIGCLCLVDNDAVALENLNRQLLHHTHDLGRPKTDSAAQKLSALNPCCRIEAVRERITAENAARMAAGCDLILDATDNASTRAALNRAALELGIPFVFGGVSGMDGMVTTVVPGRTPCLECIFPNLAETDSPAPVPALGPVVGIIASIQSLEAIKWFLGLEEDLLVGKLLSIQGRSLRFRTVSLKRNPACPACGAG
ncbi:MAG: HesA/MoeB/ThiF family protein [Desulfobacterales bacterium]|nr:HesA/MoeB/ThiF family protein [Desulfobacterales bacterium]